MTETLTDDALGLVLSACSLRSLRATKATSQRLHRLARQTICSSSWRANPVNRDELRIQLWCEGGFELLQLGGHAALADVWLALSNQCHKSES